MKTTTISVGALFMVLLFLLISYISGLVKPDIESVGETYRIEHMNGHTETITMNWCRFENGGESVYMFCQDRDEHWFAARVLQAQEIGGGE